EAPVKVEAAGRRERAEGPSGPAPRGPCRVERPALTGAGGFPILPLGRWLGSGSRARARNTVPCMSKAEAAVRWGPDERGIQSLAGARLVPYAQVCTGGALVAQRVWSTGALRMCVPLAGGDRFEAPDDGDPAGTAEGDSWREGFRGESGHAE